MTVVLPPAAVVVPPLATVPEGVVGTMVVATEGAVIVAALRTPTAKPYEITPWPVARVNETPSLDHAIVLPARPNSLSDCAQT